MTYKNVDVQVETGNLIHVPVLIPRKEVERITGMSKSWLYQAMAEGRFVKPVVCSPAAVRWVLSEVCAWVENRVSERDGALSTDFNK
jgi:prophage regulatory protein